MIFKKKESQWFKGLKFAEEVGVDEAINFLQRNEWYYGNHEFENGVTDYIIYTENR